MCNLSKCIWADACNNEKERGEKTGAKLQVCSHADATKRQRDESGYTKKAIKLSFFFFTQRRQGTVRVVHHHPYFCLLFRVFYYTRRARKRMNKRIKRMSNIANVYLHRKPSEKHRNDRWENRYINHLCDDNSRNTANLLILLLTLILHIMKNNLKNAI